MVAIAAKQAAAGRNCSVFVGKTWLGPPAMHIDEDHRTLVMKPSPMASPFKANARSAAGCDARIDGAGSAKPDASPAISYSA